LITSNLNQVRKAVEKKQLKLDANIIAARDEMMATLIKYSKEQIKGRRPQGEKATPGQPPMNRTGNLRRSIKGEKFRLGFGSYSAIVGPTIVYGRSVEVANEYAPPTWTGDTRAKGFPYMKPAYRKFKLIMPGIVRKHLLKG
jgi:hypothetical protein